MLQREIPEFVNTIAARTARQYGTITIMDVGGRDEPLTRETLENIDILTPNEVK